MRIFENAALLTRQQAAEFLGLRPQTLATWASAQRYALPYIKVGRSVRYRLRDLQDFLDRRTVGAPAGDGKGLGHA